MKVAPVDFELAEPIPYALEGDMVEGTFVKLTAPTSRNRVECARLKQSFFRALPKDDGQPAEKRDESDKKADEFTGEAIMTLIAMSQDVELEVVLLNARELFTSGVAHVEGEKDGKLNKLMLDAMDPDDFELMTGAYLVNFILASALKRLKNSSSKNAAE